MTDNTPHISAYYNSLSGYFWQWAEGGTVLEWGDGRTICYSRDLMQLQEDLLEYGWPPLGSLLLLLSACSDHFDAEATILHLRKTYKSYKYLQSEENNLLAVSDLLKIISNLPVAFRTGPARIHLIREVINPAFLQTDSLHSLLAAFRTGQIDYWPVPAGNPLDLIKTWNTDIAPLVAANRKWKDREALLQQLQTGLEQTPAAPEIAVPHISSDDLLTQMAKDRQLAGLAQLTRRLLAVIRVPLHTARQGALSYGGISDISNRGNYDRLLLSELAQDEELLMARLVNQEALFLQREEPPADPRKTRILLVDCSIRMWGLPRVFAFAAALATALQSTAGIHTRCVLLGGEKYAEADLQTLQGIRQAFSWLEPGLHCGVALEKIFPEIHSTGHTDLFFFTGDTQTGQPDFLPFWSVYRREIDFLVLANRDGHIEFMSGKDGAMKRIGEARLELETLLSTPGTEVPHISTEIAFYKKQLPPLLHPVKNRDALQHLRIFQFSGKRWLAITKNRRVLVQQYPNKGCNELIAEIEQGDYQLADNGDGVLYLLVTNDYKKNSWLYTIYLNENRISKSSPLTHLYNSPWEYTANFYKDVLKISDNYSIRYFDLHTKDLLELADDMGSLANGQSTNCPPSTFREAGAFLGDPRLTIFYRVSEIAFTTIGQLVVGKHQLIMRNPPQLKFIPCTDKRLVAVSGRPETIKRITGNSKIAALLMRWPDGSQAIADGRGFLHLRSSNPAIPEITIALILEATTACWASDGTGCGSTYFFRPDFENIIPVQDFYEKYIQAFFRQLMK
ncbi:MAG: hypothetical protein KA821_19335 [Chitinophagaceae bacterium]|nr:hypothetical protein [Chitinophagaceae bacterium]